MLEKNQIVRTVIEDISIDGLGIGKVDGFLLFIKDAIVGDEIDARIVKLKKTYGYGRVERVIKPSSFRVEPKCRFARVCGGCQLQELAYSKQLEFKESLVKNNLHKIGGFDAEYLESITDKIVGMEVPFYYRNKAQFPFGYDKEGNVVTGFYAGRTHSIIANTDCALGIKENSFVLEAMLAYMKENRVSAYNEANGKGLIRHVLIRKGFSTGEIMVCIVVNASSQNRKPLPKVDDLIRRLTVNENIVSITINYNDRNTNVILGNEVLTIYGKLTIVDKMYVKRVNGASGEFTENINDGLEYEISPLSFYQVNPVQVEKLYGIAIEYADLTGNEEVYDICCGIGTIALSMAGNAKMVHGIEIVPEAIEDAKKNAKCNSIDNAEFICAAAEEYLPQNRDSIRADVIVLDPPRKGMDERALEVIVGAAPKRIVYVSCDSATLARDLKYLCERGYSLERVRAVDMFPETGHVETVCLLSKLHEAKHHVSVKMDMDEMDLTNAESKATYEEIKKYVAEHNDGMKVSILNIAQVKRKCGIELGENYNLPKSEDSRQPQCPKEKEEAIMEALKAFQMI